MKKKNAFLLLELMIAIALIALCALPFVRGPMYVMRGEIKDLQEIELKRRALLCFMEVKEQLLNKKITWEQLGLKDELYLPEATLSLDLKDLGTGTWRRQVSVMTQKEKKSKKSEQLNRLVNVTISYSSQRKNTEPFVSTYSMLVVR